ncbi:MAG: adenylate/guanylate cyclase domain-containing protein [Cyclobacteriaceae bacterium]|nr:adenylate/guanylate cyclase domain-containing protein [Cyclobacteriaceae bacterium]
MPEPTRQLAAIMFTDIVGYTAMMGKDSNKALELVRQSVQIQKPLVEKHNGTWLKEMGDGAMTQFSSALDAVNCALEIQRTSRADFEADLRIGIHLGDITIENNDVYGDGVNVAARLESIADPGGIYISESIEKAIRGQSDIQAKYLGEVNLKNVDYGVRTYAIQGVGLPVPNLKKDKELSGRFFAEIKRRGVIRAGIMYILISLLLVLLQPFVSAWITFPDAFRTILFTALAIGFPIAVYLAWRYERSPEGIVRSNSKQSWRNPLAESQRKPLTSDFLIAGMALIIIIMYVYPRYLATSVVDIPLVVMMDSSHPKRVYDKETFEAGGTNADVISDLLLDLPIRRQKETISPNWHRDEEILNFEPDLIIIHYSGFRQEDSSGSRLRLKLLIEFLADSNTMFLIYSRTKDNVLQQRVNDLLLDLYAHHSNLKSRIKVFGLLDYGQPSLKDPVVASSLKLKVKLILGFE